MRICVLGSGSSGNAILVEGPTGRLLIDAGLSWREIERRAERAGLSTAGIAWVLLTHEHSDHVRGLGPLIRRGVRVAASAGTLRALGVEGVPVKEGMEVCGLTLYPFPLSHDAVEPTGFRLAWDGVSLGVATDLGCVTPAATEALRRCTSVIMEANHDPSMLLAGPYPWFLKMRVLGPKGHLANDEAGRALATLASSELQTVLLAHLSQENNTQACALDTVARSLADWGGKLYLSYPDRPSAVVTS